MESFSLQGEQIPLTAQPMRTAAASDTATAGTYPSKIENQCEIAEKLVDNIILYLCLVIRTRFCAES